MTLRPLAARNPTNSETSHLDNQAPIQPQGKSEINKEEIKTISLARFHERIRVVDTPSRVIELLQLRGQLVPEDKCEKFIAYLTAPKATAHNFKLRDIPLPLRELLSDHYFEKLPLNDESINIVEKKLAALENNLAGNAKARGILNKILVNAGYMAPEVAKADRDSDVKNYAKYSRQPPAKRFAARPTPPAPQIQPKRIS